METPTAQISFADLLQTAVSVPGTISSAYSAFYSYSLGNMILAASQCAQRELPLGPLATYRRWQELGRQVLKGSRALTLCQPVTIKRKDAAEGEDEFLLRFMFRANWFVLAQTSGADLPAAEPPAWDKAQALAALDVSEVPFDLIDGNVMGFARAGEFAVSPINPHAFKTTCHELAHILLGHTAEGEQADSEITPRNLRETEAEAVALLCCEALGMPGAELCRGYLQHFWGVGNAIPERSAQRILRVADQILKAGRVAEGGGL
ncbi:MAG: ArdC-like ssDNA-binding domain-containing protein [Vicinamibacterales bacterium]